MDTMKNYTLNFLNAKISLNHNIVDVVTIEKHFKFSKIVNNS